MQGDITRIYTKDGSLVAKYIYDAWGKVKVCNPDDSENTSDAFIGNINPFRYRCYYYDAENNFYYLNSRYYDPETGRFINADDIRVLDVTQEHINGLNLYAYCLNNPVNASDDGGDIPNWLKWLIGGIVIVGLAIATVATGGAAGGVAGFILSGALKGAAIGAVSGAVVGGTIGGISSAVAGDGFWSGFADGAANGFMGGAITGGITGAVGNFIKVGQAAKLWQSGKSAVTSTPYKTMIHHYKIHGKGFGNIVNYSKQASNFAITNSKVLSFVARNPKLTPHWTWIGKVGMNGHFTSAGKILSFWM